MKKIITTLLSLVAICFITGCGETDDTNSSYIDNSGIQGIQNKATAAPSAAEAVSDHTDTTEEATEPAPVSTLESIQTNFVKTAIRQDSDKLPFMTGLSTMKSIADKIISLDPDDMPKSEVQKTAAETTPIQESAVQSTENEIPTSETEIEPSEKEQ